MKELPAKKVAKMTPKMRSKYEAKLKKVKRNRKILKAVLSVVLIIAALVVIIAVAFKINSISVKDPGSHYSAQEIVTASGIDVGDNMIFTDFTNAGDRITQNLPYIGSVKFKRNLSGSVIITVVEAKPKFITACDGGYAITDDSLKTLEIVENKPENSVPTEIKFKNVPVAEPGKQIEITDDEATLYADLLEKANKNGITGITKIDISNTADISIDVQSRLRLELGDNSDIEYKLKSAAEIIKSENEISEDTVATVDLSVKGKVYVDPVDSLD
ncbi:MAG: FtsQ-type POTRA domain-containing protein [Clostridia bacterium]|nr:FtsQ-type POTRA domain-containing protein [Clostridia bacterium]